MNRARYWTAAAAALFLSLGARAAPAAGEPARKPPQRIVSLAPSVAEMLFALGLGDRIVGATDHCDFPPEAKKIPRVGGLGRPNVEKLLSLAPDIVIATDLERKDLAEALRREGIQVLELKIGNFAELFDAERKIGDAVGEPQKAARQVREMQAELDAAAEALRGHPARPAAQGLHRGLVRSAHHRRREVLLDDVVARAGGVNVAHDLSQDYPTINPERVVRWDPDVILLCYMTETKDAAAQVAGRIGWGGIKAVREGRIIADISPDVLLRPGPRLVAGVLQLAERLHPPHATQPAQAGKPAPQNPPEK